MSNSIIETTYLMSPIWIQNLLCSIYGFKEKHIRFSKIYKKKFEFFLESQWWSKDAINEYKNEQFIKILKHAYFTTNYYRNIIDEHGYNISSFQNLDDIKKLPILTKEEIRLGLNNFLSSKYDARKIKKCHTSGTSGKALSFFANEESIQTQWAIWLRFRNRFGINLFDKSCNFTGKLIAPIGQKDPPFWRINKPMNQYLINMQHIKKRNLKSIVDFLNDNNFVFYSGYPSIINDLANLIKQSDLEITSFPRYIFTGGEALYDIQKNVIEKVFNCRVVDQYGTSEGVINASKCENELFHEDFEFGHIELVNLEKNSPGKYIGDIIGTGFSNYSMPFIRYKIGDSATIIKKECSCGRYSSVFSTIEGRVEDYVITPEGTKIMRFDYLFKSQDNIKESQVIQNKVGEIIYKIVAREGYNKSDENNLIADTKKWISPSIKIKIELSNKIKRTNTGKFRAVVSNL